METALDTRRLVRESVPIALVLIFWTLLSVVALVPWLGTGLRSAGLLVAGVYVLARGRQLADEIDVETTVPESPTDVEAILQENFEVLLAAGLWFLLAMALTVPHYALGALGIAWLPGALTEAPAFVLTATGVGTVGLYSVAVAPSRLANGAIQPREAAEDDRTGASGESDVGADADADADTDAEVDADTDAETGSDTDAGEAEAPGEESEADETGRADATAED